MSRLSEFVHARFAAPAEKDATAVIMRIAGDAGAEIIEYAQKTIALLDLVDIEGGNKQGIARALITAAAQAIDVKLSPSLIGWLVEEIVFAIRPKPSAATSPMSAVPPLPGH